MHPRRLYGTGWKNATLTAEVAALYASAVEELKALGANVVEDPFKGSGFAELSKYPMGGYDDGGTETVAYDFYNYLKGFGIESLDAFVKLVGVSPFAAGEPLAGYLDTLPELVKSLLDPTVLPDLTAFDAQKAAYLRILKEVMEKYSLDALVYPHAVTVLPNISGDGFIQETTVRSPPCNLQL